MRTSDLSGLLLAGTLLLSQTALGVAGDGGAVSLPKAEQSHLLPLPTINSAPWWLDKVRLDYRIKTDWPIGEKVDLLDPKLLQVAPTQFAGGAEQGTEFRTR